MKKLLVSIIAICVVISFIGCQKEEEKDYMREDTLVEDKNPEDEALSEEDQDIVTMLETVELVTLKEAVVDVLGDNYWPSAVIPKEHLNDIYGVKEEWYSDYLGEIPLISSNADTFLLIRAKEGYAQEIERAINDYRNSLIENESEYPMNIGKIKASRIEVIHNIICFVQLGGDTTEIAEQGEEAMREYCLMQNEHAIDAIVKTLFP